MREYWIVDPEPRSITALDRLQPEAGLTIVTTATLAGGDTLTSSLFPGPRLPLRDVFRRR